MAKKLPPGIYETEYGNAAEVHDWDNEQVWDIDMGEYIPIEMVTNKFIRRIE